MRPWTTATPRPTTCRRTFEPLKRQLLAAAEAFATDARPLAVDPRRPRRRRRARRREPLEIIPVAITRRRRPSTWCVGWRSRPPRVIFMECCEDLRPLLDGLRDCRLPVALQAFAADVRTPSPRRGSPLNLVCPLTEFSAEFQAIAFALRDRGHRARLRGPLGRPRLPVDAPRGRMPSRRRSRPNPDAGRRGRGHARLGGGRRDRLARPDASTRFRAGPAQERPGAVTSASGGTSTSRKRSSTATTRPTARSCS